MRYPIYFIDIRIAGEDYSYFVSEYETALDGGTTMLYKADRTCRHIHVDLHQVMVF